MYITICVYICVCKCTYTFLTILYRPVYRIIRLHIHRQNSKKYLFFLKVNIGCKETVGLPQYYADQASSGRSSARIPLWKRSLSFLRNLQTGSVDYLHSNSLGTGSVRMTTRLHLVPSLRKSGNIPPIFLHFYIACVETILTLLYGTSIFVS